METLSLTSYAPRVRPRRLRRTPGLRSALGETSLRVEQLVHPLFVHEGSDGNRPIASMPGHVQWSIDGLSREVDDIATLGVTSILLFGIPTEKDPQGSGAWSAAGPVPRAIEAIKRRNDSLTSGRDGGRTLPGR